MRFCFSEQMICPSGQFVAALDYGRWPQTPRRLFGRQDRECRTCSCPEVAYLMRSSDGGKTRSASTTIKTTRMTNSDIRSDFHQDPGLGQARATKALQIVLPVGVLLDRHLVRDPGERNIGLSAAQFLERGRGDRGLSCHAGGGGQDAVGADKIAALANRLA